MPTSRGFNTTSEARADWAAYRCNPGAMVKVVFPSTLDKQVWPDGFPLRVVPESVEAWQWFTDCMNRHGVTFDDIYGGTYNCRKITGGSGYSLHSYGIALDLNPTRNPYGDTLVTDFPRAFIDEVLAVRTRNGKRVFRWGGDWDDDPETGHDKYDAMHFEITCSPDDLATGLAVTTTPEVPVFLPISQKHVGQRQSDIGLVAGMMNDAFGLALPEDGSWGDDMVAAVDEHLPGTDGKYVLAHQYRKLMAAFNRATAGSGGSGVDDALRARFNEHKHSEGVTSAPREVDRI